MTQLPADFLARPIAHRGLHDAAAGRVENSRAAINAAVQGGFGIEIDLQLSADHQPVVFHDDDLPRLTGQAGRPRDFVADYLTKLPLLGSDETIPDLPDILALVAGRAPLLIELKDQTGTLGNSCGALERATAAALAGYHGPVAVMSFNPSMVRAFHALAPDIPCGIVTDAYLPQHWPDVPPSRAAQLAQIAEFEASGACFISHNHLDLDATPVQALRARGIPVLCWTIRSQAAAERAMRLSDNITFEGYLPPHRP